MMKIGSSSYLGSAHENAYVLLTTLNISEMDGFSKCVGASPSKVVLLHAYPRTTEKGMAGFAKRMMRQKQQKECPFGPKPLDVCAGCPNRQNELLLRLQICNLAENMVSAIAAVAD